MHPHTPPAVAPRRVRFACHGITGQATLTFTTRDMGRALVTAATLRDHDGELTREYCFAKDAGPQVHRLHFDVGLPMMSGTLEYRDSAIHLCNGAIRWDGIFALQIESAVIAAL